MTTAARGIDPRQRTAMLAELALLRDDAFRWAGRFYTIRTKSGQMVKFVPRPAQLDLSNREQAQLRIRGEVRQYLLKARQGGFTTYAQMRNLHLVWGTTGIDALTIADKLDRTQKIFAITDRAVKHFPKSLMPEVGKKRSMELSFPNMDSSFMTDTAGSGDPARGLTLGRVHGSEFAHWENPKAVLAAVAPSVVPQGGVIQLETTANMYGDEAHEFWKEAEAGANGYEAIFYPWWECDPNYRIPLNEPDELFPLSEEESLLMQANGLDLEQIKWRRKTKAELGDAYFFREFAEDPESCWLAAGDLVFEAEMLKLLKLKSPNNPLSIPTVKGLLSYRSQLPRGERMVIGGDLGEGGKQTDRSSWYAESFPSGHPMSLFESRLVTPEQFADLLFAYAKQYNYPVICLEKNAHGITALRRLVDVHRYPTSRLYHRQSFGQNAALPTRELGWYTGPDTKPIIIDVAREWFRAIHAGRAPGIPVQIIMDAFTIRYDKHGGVETRGRDRFIAGVMARVARTYPFIPLGNQLPPTIMS